MNSEQIDLGEVKRARDRIAPFVKTTPLTEVPLATQDRAFKAFLKCEFLQDTGSFKVRGAANKILSIAEQNSNKFSIVTFSTGNHGRAVAEISRRLSLDCKVYVSELVPDNKLKMFDGSGADLVISGKDQDEAAQNAFELAGRPGFELVHPFDDVDVISGQGTTALEIAEELPDVSAILVPIGGGGLISGIAVAIKSLIPSIRVIGVQMDRNPVMYMSQKVGHPLDLIELETIADSLGGGIFLNNRHTFSIVRDYVDEIALVTEDEILQAMAFAYSELDFVLEGAGAVALAAVMHNRVDGLRGDIALIGSGGNVNPQKIRTLTAGR